MPIFYVISDVHGFYNEMQQALDTAGFNPKNKNHWIISCGDEWDRGPQPAEVMRYFNSLERKVLIRGNHTALFEELCERGYPEWFDLQNGTLETVKILGHYRAELGFDLCCEAAYNATKKYRESMVNYFETKNYYIFTHSFIPLTPYGDLYNPNWRNASQIDWDKAMWNNPYKLAESGLNQTGKTLVFGHFHTSWARHQYDGKPEWGQDADFSTFYGEDYIALDACTAYSGKVNVAVLEDEFLEELET